MKALIAVLAVLATACSFPTSPVVPARPASANAVVDRTAPAAPSDVSATLDSVKSQRAYLTVAWTDNSTAVDEFGTCFRFTETDGTAATTQCVYGYDVPAGSTGQRSGSVVVPKGGPYLVYAYTWRRFRNDDNSWENVRSDESAPATVCASQHC